MMNDAICFGEKQEKQFWTGYEDFQFGCVELEMGVRDLNGETSEWLDIPIQSSGDVSW